MRRLFLIAVITAIVLPTLLSAASKSYDVSHYGNCVAEIVTSNGYVRQYYRNTLDSLVRISWWCGDTSGGGLYDVVVADSADPLHIIARGRTVASAQRNAGRGSTSRCIRTRDRSEAGPARSFDGGMTQTRIVP